MPPEENPVPAPSPTARQVEALASEVKALSAAVAELRAAVSTLRTDFDAARQTFQAYVGAAGSKGKTNFLDELFGGKK